MKTPQDLASECLERAGIEDATLYAAIVAAINEAVRDVYAEWGITPPPQFSPPPKKEE